MATTDCVALEEELKGEEGQGGEGEEDEECEGSMFEWLRKPAK